MLLSIGKLRGLVSFYIVSLRVIVSKYLSTLSEDLLPICLRFYTMRNTNCEVFPAMI